MLRIDMVVFTYVEIILHEHFIFCPEFIPGNS